MIMKRLRFLLFAIPVCIISVLIIGAQRSHPANAGGVIDPTCVSSLPCIEYDNNGTGPGIRGISVSGNGLAGATKNAGTSAANGRAGLIGNDVGTGTFNSGVHGLSVGGTGVSGASTNGTGVNGQSTNGPGLSGTSTNNDGVDGVTSNPSLTRSPRSGVFGFDDSSDGGHGNGGVVGLSTNGVGVAAGSTNFIGAHVSGGGSNGPALSVNGNDDSDLIVACKSPGLNPCISTGTPVPEFLVQATGSVVITGRIFTAGSCSVGCASSPSGGEKRVRLFTPQESLPTVEDFGQAQLVGGRTYVRIDPAFANTMDEHAA
jgi:hypothetical protein